MLKRKFVLPVNAAEEATEADLLSYLGISQSEGETTAEEPAAEEEAKEEEETPPAETQTEEEPQAEQEPEAKPEPQAPAKPAPKKNRADEAFAAMRVENKKLNSMLSDLASIIGVNSKDPNEITNALQEQIFQAKSKQQGIPADVLKKIQDLEEANNNWNREQARMQAYRGFQVIKDTFGLEDGELNAFADELAAEDLNPFEGRVDVVTEYKLRNFDKLIQAAVDRGIRQEQERASKASKASTPTKQTGKAPSNDAKINSVAELSAWLESVSK